MVRPHARGAKVAQGGSACGLAGWCRLPAWSCRSCEDAAWAAWLAGIRSSMIIEADRVLIDFSLL
ncbi:MAG: hypothetical protein WAW52_03255 [Methanothrix sp.]